MPHFHGETLLSENVAFEGFVPHGLAWAVQFSPDPNWQLQVDSQLGGFVLSHPRLDTKVSRLQGQIALYGYRCFSLPGDHVHFKFGLKGSYEFYTAMPAQSAPESYLMQSHAVTGLASALGAEFKPLPFLPLWLSAHLEYAPYLWMLKESPLLPPAVQGIAWSLGLDYKWQPFVLRLEYYNSQQFNTGWRRQNHGLKIGVGYEL